MELYALKSDEGYLKIKSNDDYIFVKIDKASVYSANFFDRLKELSFKLKNETQNLRIVKLTISEEDHIFSPNKKVRFKFA
ncbi:MAG: hypothetical protein ACRCU3_10715 [Eubacteriaceae bacterium]